MKHARSIARPSVAIVGLGGQTAVGRLMAHTAAAVHAGISRLGDHPTFVDRRGESIVVARASYLSDDLDAVDRLVALAKGAIEEACWPCRGSRSPLAATLVLGLPGPRPGLSANAAGEIAARLEDLEVGPLRFTQGSTLIAGHAAGLMALGDARRGILAGEYSLCLAGGVDSYLEPETLEWLEASDQLHGEANPWGFTPGEGAGFCLLADAAFAGRQGLRAFGEVAAVATAVEANRIKTATVCVGEGLTDAWRAALRQAPQGAAVAQLLCDLNGEPYRADELGFALARLSRHFEDPRRFTAPADCWGDVGAASGPLFAGLAIVDGLRAWKSARRCLLSTSAESGERCAAVLDVGTGDEARAGSQSVE